MGGAARGAPWLDVGVALRALPGQRTSGDCEVVRVFDGGVLLAALDGLGHGAEAAHAARRGCAALERYAGESPVSLMHRCQTELQGTRGAAISLASLSGRDATLSWLSVGNVEGVLWRREEDGVKRADLVTRGGVVGNRLPSLRADVLTVGSGDTLVLATDGIRREFAEHVELESSPQQLANQILSRYARENDDALVLVARFTLARG